MNAKNSIFSSFTPKDCLFPPEVHTPLFGDHGCGNRNQSKTLSTEMTHLDLNWKNCSVAQFPRQL